MWVLEAWSRKSCLGPAKITSFVFLVLFKDAVRRVSLGFHLFVSGVNQGNEKAVWIQDFLAWPQEWKDSHLDLHRAVKNWECALDLGSGSVSRAWEYWTISKNIIFFESEKCHMRRLFRIYWKLIYLLEGVGRVVTGMQLGGGGWASPALFWKLKKSTLVLEEKNALTKFLSNCLNSMKPPLPWRICGGKHV